MVARGKEEAWERGTELLCKQIHPAAWEHKLDNRIWEHVFRDQNADKKQDWEAVSFSETQFHVAGASLEPSAN